MYHLLTLRPTCSSAQYPKVFEEFMEFKRLYGDVSSLPTKSYLTGPERGAPIYADIEQGKTLHIMLKAVGETNKDGRKEVFFEVNGHPRSVFVDDKKALELKVKILAPHFAVC